MVKMTQIKQKIPYSQWKPSITPEDVFSDIVTFAEIKIIDKTIYWLEQRPVEQGRVVLVKYDESEISDVVPTGFWVRTRVHEYGGGAYALNSQFAYFTNFTDQRIYCQSLTDKQAPQPLTPAKNVDGSLGKYAALGLSPHGKTLVFVYEKEYATKENDNFIAALDLTLNEPSDPTILAYGNDFYADPQISPDGKKLAWLTWNHPKMPWESTELIMAELEGTHLVEGSEQKIAGGLTSSICLPKFDPQGTLYFVMDEVGQDEKPVKNWWNLYCYKNGKTEPVTKELVEFGAPMWRLGQSTYSFLSDGKLIGRTIVGGKATLVVVDPKKQDYASINLPFTEFSSLGIDSNDDLVFVGASPLDPLAVVKLNLASMKMTVLKISSSIELQKEDVSIPQFITYPTSDGESAHGHLYLPKNSKYEAPVNNKPPLLVMVHGGPTGRAYSALSLSIQFWTSQGYAILDVDHRGSTGYGRKYRDALLGEWGVIDASDIKGGVDYLINQSLVSNQIVIRGGSAGGYAVQRALTLYPDLFAAGASYFGIGNLITLAETIHKFEAHYLDSLLGSSLVEDITVYQERSPINHLDNLKAPMIILQGSEDKIVTPQVSQEMAQALEKRGIDYEYHEYEGEAHGFRSKDANIDALNREASFYKKVLYG